MKKLFDSIVKGLQKEGYRLIGGGDLFAILDRYDNTVKVFKAYKSNYFIIRYS